MGPMTRFLPRIRCLTGLVTVPVLLTGVLGIATSQPAAAQSPVTGGVLGPGSSTAAAGNGQPSGETRSRRPSALPGTHTEKVEPAPADRIATDMAPNEALFDAINRGDMASVKDAISRGAELNTRNVLGLTPIDLSVDLGQNDITFLLLSLRGADSAGSAPPPPGAAKSAKADLLAAAKSQPKPAKTARAAKEIAPPAPAAPKLFANDGGTPLPNAGFLGFGAQR